MHIKFPRPEHEVALYDEDEDANYEVVRDGMRAEVGYGDIFVTWVNLDGQPFTYCGGNDGGQTYGNWRYPGHVPPILIAMEVALENAILANATTDDDVEIDSLYDDESEDVKRIEIISLLVGCLNEEDVLQLVAHQLGDDARALLAGDLGLSD